MILRRLTHMPLPRLAGLLILTALPTSVACGKKGPPLPPLQTTPGRIEDLAAARRGEDVRVRFSVPKVGSDNQPTRDIEAVEIYGLTGKAEGPTGAPLTTLELLKYATLVGRAAVKPPPEEPKPESDNEEKAAKADQKKAEAARLAPPVDPRPGQGEVVTMHEAITAEVMKPWVHPKKKVVEKKTEIRPGTPLWWPGPDEDQLARMYVGVALNRHGKPGAMSNRVAMPLSNPPAPPVSVTADFSASAISLTWPEAPNARRATQPPATAEVLPSKPLVLGASPTTYNVYDVTPRTGAAPAAPVAAPASGSKSTTATAAAVAAALATTNKPEIVSGPGGEYVIAPTPLNPAPLPVLAFVDTRLAFGQSRCYVVRSTQAFGAASLESAPSPVTCVSPVDKFPPEAPKNLSAVAGESGVSLIWEPNTEPDLAGYIVLRGELPADGSAPKLAPLTPAPIAETTYRDGAARPGVRYVYAVIAVDRSAGANRSPESNHVEATVR